MKKTPKEKVKAALELRQHKGVVPTFELEFQLAPEVLGRDFHKKIRIEGGKIINDWEGKTPKEKEKMLNENAELFVALAEKLDYSIIMEAYSPTLEDRIRMIKLIRGISGEKYFLIGHGDATYFIPFTNIEEYCVSFFHEPEKKLEFAEKWVKETLEEGKKLVGNGLDGFALCSDYCDNRGSFFSPKMFDTFIHPFLKKLIRGYREMGAYVIKHTDGNIMPIIDKLIDCQPHALHSLDPSGGVDIKTVAERYSDKVCLVGNVECALLHIGTKEQVEDAAKYALQHAMPKLERKPRGGYIFSTSNIVFRAETAQENQKILENYAAMLDVRKKFGKLK